MKASAYIDIMQLSSDEKKKYNITKNGFIVAYLLTLGISLAIAVLYILKVFYNIGFHWEELFNVSEIAALSMFFIFIIADLKIRKLFIYSKETNVSRINSIAGNETDQIEKIQNAIRDIDADLGFLRKAIPLIDITGFIGISLIYAITIFFKHYHELMFFEGFAIGAIAFHIFFTQMNFVILKYLEKNS